MEIERIELSEEHKLKLREMIVMLFPSIRFVKISDGSCDYCLENTLILAEKAHPKHNEWELVHWFEFCVNDIVNALAFNNIITDLLADVEYEHFRMQFISEIFRGKTQKEIFHVVDYLYNIFVDQNKES